MFFLFLHGVWLQSLDGREEFLLATQILMVKNSPPTFLLWFGHPSFIQTDTSLEQKFWGLGQGPKRKPQHLSFIPLPDNLHRYSHLYTFMMKLVQFLFNFVDFRGKDICYMFVNNRTLLQFCCDCCSVLVN